MVLVVPAARVLPSLPLQSRGDYNNAVSDSKPLSASKTPCTASASLVWEN